MTSIILFFSDISKFLLSLVPSVAFVTNWILFFTGVSFFAFWCLQLIKKYGGQKDKVIYSNTEGKKPYYDPQIYTKEE